MPKRTTKARPALPQAGTEMTPALKEAALAAVAALDAETETQRYAGQIRQSLIEQVLSDVEDFINHAQPLDLWFLHEVLFAHDQGHFWASGSLLEAFFEVAPTTDAPEATVETLRAKAA
jgi:hypothetical protein